MAILTLEERKPIPAEDIEVLKKLEKKRTTKKTTTTTKTSTTKKTTTKKTETTEKTAPPTERWKELPKPAPPPPPPKEEEKTPTKRWKELPKPIPPPTKEVPKKELSEEEKYEKQIEEEKEKAQQGFTGTLTREEQRARDEFTRFLIEEKERAKKEFERQINATIEEMRQRGVSEDQITRWKMQAWKKFKAELDKWSKERSREFERNISEWKKQEQSRFNVELARWEQEQRGRFEEIEKLIEELQSYAPGSAEFEDIKKQLQEEYGVTVVIEEKTKPTTSEEEPKIYTGPTTSEEEPEPYTGPPRDIGEALGQFFKPVTDIFAPVGEAIKKASEPIEWIFEGMPSPVEPLEGNVPPGYLPSKEAMKPAVPTVREIVEDIRELSRELEKQAFEIGETSPWLGGAVLDIAVATRMGAGFIEGLTSVVRPKQWVEGIETTWQLITSPEKRAEIAQAFTLEPLAMAEVPGAIAGAYVGDRLVGIATRPITKLIQMRLTEKVKFPGLTRAKIKSALKRAVYSEKKLEEIMMQSRLPPEALGDSWRIFLSKGTQFLPEGAEHLIDLGQPILTMEKGKPTLVYKPSKTGGALTEYSKRFSFKGGKLVPSETPVDLTPEGFATSHLVKYGTGQITKTIQKTGQISEPLLTIKPSSTWVSSFKGTLGAAVELAKMKEQAQKELEEWRARVHAEKQEVEVEPLSKKALEAAEGALAATARTRALELPLTFQEQIQPPPVLGAYEGPSYPGLKRKRRFKEELEYQYYTMPGEVERLTPETSPIVTPEVTPIIAPEELIKPVFEITPVITPSTVLDTVLTPEEQPTVSQVPKPSQILIREVKLDPSVKEMLKTSPLADIILSPAVTPLTEQIQVPKLEYKTKQVQKYQLQLEPYRPKPPRYPRIQRFKTRRHPMKGRRKPPVRAKKWVVPHPIAAPKDLLQYVLGVQPKPQPVKKKVKVTKKKGKPKKPPVKKKKVKKKTAAPPTLLEMILS